MAGGVVRGPPTAFDMLMCALAVRHGLAIFTTDTDFVGYAKILPVRLHPWVPPDEWWQ